MLRYLRIRDLAIIEETEVEWGEGFNVITGETGAGKSIIVTAVSLIRGEKASQDFIRSGRKRAIIEAVFSNDRKEVSQILTEKGIEDGEEIILRRIIEAGRSKNFINDTSVTLSTLQEIAPYLIGIEGQHSQQLLLQPRFYLIILDHFAGLEEDVKEFSQLYNRWKKLREEIEEIQEKERERKKRIDFLQYQIEEIEKISPRKGEDEELEREKKILSEGENLKREIEELIDYLYTSDASVISSLKNFVRKSERFTQFGEKWEKLHSLLSEALYQLEEAVFLGEGLSGEIETDPLKLEQITERLLELGELKRKYGPTIEDVLRELEKLKKEKEELEKIEFTLAEKEEELKKIQREMEQRAEKLSSERKRAAKELEKKVEKELSYLAMERAKFLVEVERGEMGPSGRDRVTIKISPNPGEPLKPLQKVASGGELSRIMLALRVALGEKNPPSTIIFDEIDAGIGGKTAESVGRKLNELSERSQLIVITHLPQIALFATHHFVVEKVVEGGRTISRIRRVEGEDRVKEIARMIGKIDGKTLEYARELLRSAENQKSENV